MKICQSPAAIFCLILCSSAMTSPWAQSDGAPDVTKLPLQAANDRDPAPFMLNDQTRKLLNRSGTYLEDLGGGRMGLQTGGGHKHVLLARVGAGGKVETYCTDSIHSAQNWAQAAEAGEVQK